MKINPTLSRDAVYPKKRFLWRTAKKIIMIIKLVFESKFDGRLLLSYFYFDSDFIALTLISVLFCLQVVCLQAFSHF